MKPMTTTACILVLTVLVRTVFALNPDEPQQNLQQKLQEIREAIDARGAHWTADMTDVFRLPLETQVQMLGCSDSVSMQPIATSEQLMGYAWQPQQFDWRDHQGQNWMTDVRNQGACGSCVAFGTISALEGQLNIHQDDPNLDMDLSEQHLFNCGGGTCEQGWWTSNAYQYLQNSGVPDEECFPYTSGSTGLDQPCSNTCPDWRERVTQISCWGFVGGDDGAKTPAQIKEQLLKGPITTTMTVFEDFSAYQSGIYEHVYGDQLGGHAVCFVGWDDTTDPPCWIVRNSWGTWGEGGYFRIRMGTNEVGIESNNLYLMLGDVPRGDVSDNGHLFGRVEVGQSEDWRFSLANVGEADLELYGFVGDLADFTISTPTSLPQIIVPGKHLEVTTTFTPDTAGFRYDRIEILSNSCRPLPNLKLRGTGIIHNVTVTPKAIEETVAQGERRKTPPVTVTYSGDSTLTYTVTVLREWLSAEPQSGTIEAGGNLSLDVTLDASSLDPGEYNTNILIHTDDPTDQVVVVAVRLYVQESVVILRLPTAFRTVNERVVLPLAIDNQTHLTVPVAEISMRLGFDSDLLSVQTVSPTSRIASMSSFHWSIPEPGELSLSISDGYGNTITPGTGDILEITFLSQEGLNCEDTTLLETSEAILTDTTGTPLNLKIEGGSPVFRCKGDINIDGMVDVLDVLAVVNHILDLRLLDDDVLYRADCDGDGEINVIDALGIVNVILNLGTCAP